jgi:hypothetical protein
VVLGPLVACGWGEALGLGFGFGFEEGFGEDDALGLGDALGRSVGIPIGSSARARGAIETSIVKAVPRTARTIRRLIGIPWL